MSHPSPLRVDVLTIFPDYLAPLKLSLLGKAIERGLLQAQVHDLRHWTDDVHRTVDDSPYGGGPGMVLAAPPWGAAFDELVPAGTAVPPTLLVPSPSGERFTQAIAAQLAWQPWLMFACGRYEGMDARVLAHAATRMTVREISLGDYVLFGGEVAALAILEAVVRLLPGVLGNDLSAVQESFSDGLLEAPVYTKPAMWRGLEVPSVLRSGDHAAIGRWRRDQAVQRTRARRPDLLDDL